MTESFGETTDELCKVESEIEALALDAELADHGIRALVVPHRSGARPDQIQPRHGWGRIRVVSRELDRARAVVERWRRDRTPMHEDELAAIAMAGAHDGARSSRGRVPGGSAYRGGPGVDPHSPPRAPGIAVVVVGAVALVSILYGLFTMHGC